ncbi:MAG TPA: hypothetical protein VFT50_04050 [Baekduia sp.]|nr:hypothetical protein [Baekduia sp.]
MKQKILGLLVGGLALAAASGPALAASPATVTVRVEGSSGALLAPTTVTTTTTPVVKDGTHQCTGTSAAGALELATGGNWAGSWDAGFGTYSVERIKGEDYGAFSASAPYFWAFVINGGAADGGICGEELQPGDDIVFYTGCNASSTSCYPFDSSALQATAPATAAPGQPLSVAVTAVSTTFDSSPPYAAHTTRAPAAGAEVRAGGVAATTGADGTASVTLADRGPVTLRVTGGPKAVPYERTLCVTDGHDGFCGTAAPSTQTGSEPPASAPPAAAPPCTTDGHDGFCGTTDTEAAYGFVSSIREHQRFRRHHGPRDLSGRVDADGSGLQDVELRLTRSRHWRHCATFDGTRERFVRLRRCGAAHGRWFSVGDQSDWTYLVPRRLARGRYVLDVRVTDRAGNRDTTLARGRNRVVFVVG